MAEKPDWRAGFEIEVVLGGLGDARFENYMLQDGPMDMASPEYCKAVARHLRRLTGRKWRAPRSSPSKPGFYVISEYGLDPIHWPEGRVAGVELLTPPLSFGEADRVRSEIVDAIEEIDGYFNFDPCDVTADCAWHINIDGGEALRLDPQNYILGTDELLLLSRNDRLFSQYAGLQRHAVGTLLLRCLEADKEGKLLGMTGLENLLLHGAGKGKRYAANFSKLERGYVELRHFSGISFFNGPPLSEQLERIPAAFEIWPNQSGALERVFLERFLILRQWLDDFRSRIRWEMKPFNIVFAEGDLLFDNERVGVIQMNGPMEIHLLGSKEYDYIASIREVIFPDVAEALALLALDLAELRNLGIKRPTSRSKAFRKAVVQLATQLKSHSSLSSAHQHSILMEAQKERSAEREKWGIGETSATRPAF